MPVTRRRLSAHLVLASALLLGGAACSDDGDGDADATSTTSPTTTAPATTLSGAEQDEQALRQLAEDWYVVINRIHEGGEDLALADDFIVGQYREQFIDDVEERRAEGLTSRAGPTAREVIESVEVAGGSATLETCFVDDGTLFDASGDVVDDTTYTYQFRTFAEQTSDGWRFNRRDQLSEEVGDLCD